MLKLKRVLVRRERRDEAFHPYWLRIILDLEGDFSTVNLDLPCGIDGSFSVEALHDVLMKFCEGLSHGAPLSPILPAVEH